MWWILNWSSNSYSWTKMLQKWWSILHECTLTIQFRVNPKEFVTITILKISTSCLLPRLTQAPSIRSMQRWQIPSFLGKMKVGVNSWKWEVLKLGNVTCKHQNLSKYGQKDIHKKLFVFLMIAPLKRFLLDSMMESSTLSVWLKQDMKILFVIRFIRVELLVWGMIHWQILCFQSLKTRISVSVMERV